MLNLKGFCSLSNGHLKKARPGVRFSIIEKTAMHRFSRFPQPSCVKGAASGHKWHTCYAMVLWNCCACCHPVRASRGYDSKPNQSFWVWLQARNRMSFQPNKKHPMPLCLSAAPFPLCLRRSLRPAVQRGFPGCALCCIAKTIACTVFGEPQPLALAKQLNACKWVLIAQSFAYFACRFKSSPLRFFIL